MERTIFYSWQSDLLRKSNLNLIEASINNAIKWLSNKKPIDIRFTLDKATRQVPGSPDIVESIFSKINKSSVFIADISIINNSDLKKRKTPNPNVLIELGYAVRTLGWDNVICVFNESYGKLDDLPFDLRNRRIMRYDSTHQHTKACLSKEIFDAIMIMHKSGLLFNKIFDFLKGEIDKVLLNTIDPFIRYIKKDDTEDNFFHNVNSFLSLDEEGIKSILLNKKVLGFYVLKNFEVYEEQIKNILNQAICSNYYSREIINPLIEIFEWYAYYNTTKSRYSDKYLQNTSLKAEEFSILGYEKLGKKDDHKNRMILGKKLGDNKFIVVNSGDFSDANLNFLTTIFIFKEDRLDKLSSCIYRLIASINEWLDLTNGEIIMDFVGNYRIKKSDGDWL